MEWFWKSNQCPRLHDFLEQAMKLNWGRTSSHFLRVPLWNWKRVLLPAFLVVHKRKTIERFIIINKRISFRIDFVLIYVSSISRISMVKLPESSHFVNILPKVSHLGLYWQRLDLFSVLPYPCPIDRGVHGYCYYCFNVYHPSPRFTPLTALNFV